MKYLAWALLPSLVACTTPGKGLLLDQHKQASRILEENELERHCDMDDSGACYLLKKAAPAEMKRLPIAQGIAPPGKAVFTVLLSRQQQALWFLREPGSLKLEPLRPSHTISRPHSPYRLERYELSQLDSAKTYELLGIDANGMIIDLRSIRTLSPSSATFRFALVANADESRQEEQNRQWPALMEHKPDLILALGDFVYGNERGGKSLGMVVSAETLWDRHLENRLALSLFRLPQLAPLAATWDDRDFGMTDGNETYSQKDESREIMEAFFPAIADAKAISEGPGIARSLKAGNQIFLLLDGRTFRSPETSALEHEDYSSTETLFGRIQEDWAMSLIKSQAEGIVWLLSGTPWFGPAPPYPSYENLLPESHTAFLTKVRAAAARAALENKHPAVAFGNGHGVRAEIMRIRPFSSDRYEAFQLLSSGVHAPTENGSKTGADPRRIEGVAGQANYMIVSVSPGKSGVTKVEAQALGIGNNTLFRRTLELTPVVPVKKKRRR